MFQRPLQMRLREHHCSVTGTPIMSGSDSEQLDIFKAWLPERYAFAENKVSSMPELHF